MVMRITKTGGSSRSSSRIRLGSSHRTGLRLTVSHRNANDWTAPDKDRPEPHDRGVKGGGKHGRR
jgi:hypothetical protein